MSRITVDEDGVVAVPVSVWAMPSRDAAGPRTYTFTTGTSAPPFATVASATFGAFDRPVHHSVPVRRFALPADRSLGTGICAYGIGPEGPPGFVGAGVAFHAYAEERPDTVPVREYRRIDDGAELFYYSSVPDQPEGYEPRHIAFWAPPPAPPDPRRVLVLSDVHIGDGSPTVWYQPEVHEQYLVAILDWAARNPAVHEVVLLGDIVDFWTYPFDRRPPSFAEIARANPEVFGERGAIARLLDAKDGRVIYVEGNHDHGVTSHDVATIRSPRGHAVRWGGREYRTGDVVLTHGHAFTLFNASDPDSPWEGLPIGHFVTRMVADHWHRELTTGQTVADLPGQGAPNGIDLTGVVQGILIHRGDFSVSRALIDSVAKTTGADRTAPILLPGAGETTLAEVSEQFAALWSQWTARAGGDQVGFQMAAKAALADGLAYYMGSFAQQLAFERSANLVVMGHTHTPIGGLDGSLIDYVNSGFECPSVPDMASQPMTFAVVSLDGSSVELHRVVSDVAGEVQVVPFEAQRTSVVAGPSMDFSCYVVVDNTNGAETMQLTGAKVGHGYFVVPPPETIPPGGRALIWLQDLTGVHGSDAWFEYEAENGARQRFDVDCPTGFYPNACRGGARFVSKSGDGPWGGLGSVATWGHPLFVYFSTT